MATWRAKCWLGSESGYQNLEVQSDTYQGAEQQLRRIYGAEQIINLQEVRGESNSLFSGDEELSGWLMIGSVIFIIWLIIEYWWIIIPLAAIVFALWLWVKDD